MNSGPGNPFVRNREVPVSTITQQIADLKARSAQALPLQEALSDAGLSVTQEP